MATIKSYTDIEQSRRLAKILEVDTADCYYPVTYIEESTNKHLMCYIKPYIGRLSDIECSVDTRLYVPCWSLAALLNALPTLDNKHAVFGTSIKESKWHIIYHNVDTLFLVDSGLYSNPVDACVAMIEKFNELDLL